MNLKQAQTIVSDLLMKCEQESLALPQDPLEALLEAIDALRSNMKHELRRSQMEMALEHMRSKYGVRSGAMYARHTQSALVKSTSDKKRRVSSDASDTSRPTQQRYMRTPSAVERDRAQTAATLRTASVHSPAKKKTRLQDRIQATPAVRAENQRLVDQLIELGELEMHAKHAQRGVTRLRAAQQIHDATDVIKSGAQARQLDGIGESNAGKIDELLHGGLHDALQEYADDKRVDATKLQRDGEKDGENDEQAVTQAVRDKEEHSGSEEVDEPDADMESDDEYRGSGDGDEDEEEGDEFSSVM